MFERFTDRARRVVVLAQEAARDMEHCRIDPGHILLGLIEEGEGLAWRALTNILGDDGVNALQVKTIESLRDVPTVTIPPPHIPFTPSSKKVLELSLREGLQLGHNYIGTEHILLSIVRFDVLREERAVLPGSVELHDLRKEIIRLIMEAAPKEPAPPSENMQEISAALAEAMEQIASANKALMLAAHTISGLADKLK